MGFFIIMSMKDIINKAILFLIKNNESNHLPYHGIDHVFMVYEKCKYSVNRAEYRHTVKHINELLIAALFHDYNHSGGKLKDSENIKNAIIGCKAFVDELNSTSDEATVSMEIVTDIIKATEYPNNMTQLTVEQQIIQDADMGYLFENIAIVKLYSGLRDEFGTTLDEFLQNQLKFLNSVKFHSRTLQHAWDYTYRQIRIDELQTLIELNK